MCPATRSERCRLSVFSDLRTGASGAGANVEKNVEKKPSQLAWKARMCGLANEVSLIVFALCSLSTGRSKTSCLRLPRMRRELSPRSSRTLWRSEMFLDSSDTCLARSGGGSVAFMPRRDGL